MKVLFWGVGGLIVALIIGGVTILSVVSEAFAFWGGIGLLGLATLIIVVLVVIKKRKKTVLEPPSEVEIDDEPEILAPEVAAQDVSLTPVFAWKAVPDAHGYYFELADNANFVNPLVKLDGDLGRLIVTAYVYVKDLDYSSAYYWRVKAVSGTIEDGDLKESAWVASLFITIDKPSDYLKRLTLKRLTTGKEVLNLVTHAYMLKTRSDELKSQEEVTLVGSFFQNMQDVLDIPEYIGEQDAFDLNRTLEELQCAGFFVFGTREVTLLEGGNGPDLDFPIAILEVLRSDTPGAQEQNK